jgi:hypothetical protein
MPHIKPLHVVGLTNERHSPAFRTLVDAGNFVLTEFRQAPSLVACLQLAAMNEKGAASLDEKAPKQDGQPSARFQNALHWARMLHGERFHPIYASSVLAMWAVIEASVEDTFAALLEMSRATSEKAVSMLKPGKYRIEDWPWTSDVRVEIAKQLQTKAKNIQGRDHSAFPRLKTMYAFIDVDINLDPAKIKLFNEIVQVRNVLVHRNGRISDADVAHAPELEKFQNSEIRIDNVRYALYGTALIAFHAALVAAVGKFETTLKA